MEFSEQVKYVREKLFLSQEMLAKELGVSFATVNRWEDHGVISCFFIARDGLRKKTKRRKAECGGK